jgi:hypothetical protein
MTPEELSAAFDVIEEVTDTLHSLHNKDNKTVEAGLQLEISKSYLMELLHYIREGKSPIDAVRKMAHGELPIGV